MSAIPIICLLVAALCLVGCAWSLFEIVAMAHRVRAALELQKERQDLFFAIAETERKIKEEKR